VVRLIDRLAALAFGLLAGNAVALRRLDAKSWGAHGVLR